MRIVESFPHAFREVEHLWIELADGCRLAARLWLPEGAERAPVPAVIEYIPYGKRIGTRERDEGMHRWFAGHGLAALRVDLRGSGESEGVLRDEYLPLEQADGVELIAWVAAQPWCSGAVGLMGKSWGGFNALQIAAQRPPALRSIITVCSTDDRYADDVHYMGGCLLNDNLWWGGTLFQLAAQPPDPELVGDAWRALWRQRLEAAEPPVLEWLRHPLRDAYWRQGSVCEDYPAITCPVWAVGGWADAYTNAVPRLLAGLRAPARGLVGPWGHTYPHEGAPGPAIGFLQAAVRWWHATLREDSRLPPDEPAYRVWLPESVPAGSDRADRPGRWVAEPRWPSPRIERRALALGRGTLEAQPPARGAVLEVASPQTLGRAAGGWLVAGTRDQREDDALSLCFDSEPLTERLELLGAAELRLVLACDRPVAFVAARLCDVAPDKSSVRVSYGLRNLTHADDHASWTPIVPSRRFEVSFRLNDAAWAFPPGHRLRLALSTAYWPLVWPSPAPAMLKLWTDGSRLDLPVRPHDPADASLPAFELAARAPHSEWTPITKGGFERTSERDHASGDEVSRLRSGRDEAGRVALARLDAVDMEGGDALETELRIQPNDPLRAAVSMSQRSDLRRGNWRVSVENTIRISCTRDALHVEARLAAFEQENNVFERHWDELLPRRGL